MVTIEFITFRQIYLINLFLDALSDALYLDTLYLDALSDTLSILFISILFISLFVVLLTLFGPVILLPFAPLLSVFFDFLF